MAKIYTVVNSTTVIPINHLIIDKRKFDGGFTFARNDRKSQIDWCFTNPYGLKNISNFTISRNHPQISDHEPIIADVEINGEPLLKSLLYAAREINTVVSNHSCIPVIKSENTNLDTLNNLLKIEIHRTDTSTMTSQEISRFLTENIHKYGKITKIPKPNRIADEKENIRVRNDNVISVIEQNTLGKWRFLDGCNDSKKL